MFTPWMTSKISQSVHPKCLEKLGYRVTICKRLITFISSYLLWVGGGGGGNCKLVGDLSACRDGSSPSIETNLNNVFTRVMYGYTKAFILITWH